MTQTIESSNKELQEVVAEHLQKNNELANLIGKPDVPTIEVEEYFAKKIQGQKDKIFGNLKNLHSDNINQICEDVAILSDLEMGIFRSKSDSKLAFVGNEGADKSPVIIRDTRFQLAYGARINKAEEGAHATLPVALGSLKAALKVIEDSIVPGNEKKAAQEKGALTADSNKIFKTYADRILYNAKTQSERNKHLKNMNHELVGRLKNSNLLVGKSKAIAELSEKDLLNGFGQVRDLTNLDAEPHSSIVTIAQIGKDRCHVEATIPVKPLSGELEKYYTDGDKQDWQKALNPLLRQSLNQGEYRDKIRGGKHMISSQLPVPGLRNAAVEHSMVVNNQGKIQNHNRQILRSGTPGHNNGKKSKDNTIDKQRLDIGAKNVTHAQNLCRKDVDIICLNSKLKETAIVSGVEDAVAPNLGAGGDRYHNLPISIGNKAMNLAAIWKNFKEGAGERIQYISCKSGKDRTQAAITQSVLNSVAEVRVLNSEGKEEGINKDIAQQSIVRAGHGNAVAANVGATIGINGTKISNVFSGLKYLPGESSVLLKFKKELSSKLASLNHFKTTEPDIPSELQKRAEAIAGDKAQAQPAAKKSSRLSRLRQRLRGKGITG